MKNGIRVSATELASFVRLARGASKELGSRGKNKRKKKGGKKGHGGGGGGQTTLLEEEIERYPRSFERRGRANEDR